MNGGKVMENIKALWMNNGDESLLHFIDEAKPYGIDINTCRSMKECYVKLGAKTDKWEAIIFNANCRLEEEKPKISNIDKPVKRLRTAYPYIPRFVVINKEKVNYNERIHLKVLEDNEEYYLLKFPTL